MNLTSSAIAASSRFNSKLLKFRGEKSSVVVVCEFPKSGGTWFAKMLATATQLPYIERNVGLLLIPSVIRTHWEPSYKYSPCVYVIRDPRDVMTSLFHHRCKNISHTPKLANIYKSKFGEELSTDKISSQMSRFIEIEFEHKLYGAQCPWDIHIVKAKEACKLSNKSILLKYEDIIANPAKCLQQTIIKLYDTNISMEKLKLVEELYSKNMSSDAVAHTERTFLRKGIAGDWRNVFDQKSAVCISKFTNNAIVELGYEKSDDWWQDLPVETK